MSAKPIHKREFHAFLSHAHADKAVVDHLHDLAFPYRRRVLNYELTR
jgi:hypothetical protein